MIFIAGGVGMVLKMMHCAMGQTAVINLFISHASSTTDRSRVRSNATRLLET